MKLISLNTWGGRGGKEMLLDFFARHKDVDVFCLQEIWSGGEEMLGVKAGGSPLEGITTTLLADIGEVLSGHAVFFRPHFKDYYGLAMFVRKTLKVKEEGEVFVYQDRGFVSGEDPGNHARNIQYVTLEKEGGLKTVINFHGMWNGRGKGDAEERVLQSANIVNFVSTLAHPFVLVGDFNLNPETESLKTLEDFPLRNLIKEYGITSTRTSLYTKENRFADYCLVSDGVEVEDFKILPDEVSDHAPLFLEWR